MIFNNSDLWISLYCWLRCYYLGTYGRTDREKTYRQGTQVKTILTAERKHKSAGENEGTGSQAPCIILLIIWKGMASFMSQSLCLRVGGFRPGGKQKSNKTSQQSNGVPRQFTGWSLEAILTWHYRVLNTAYIAWRSAACGIFIMRTKWGTSWGLNARR